MHTTNDPALMIMPLLLGMFAILIAGTVIGNKISRKTAMITWLALGAMSVYGIVHFLLPMFTSHQSNFVATILGTMGPLYFGVGLFLGRSRRTSGEQYTTMLAGWQKQLASDEADKADDLIIVYDLTTIAELCYYRLGKNDQAAKALDRAYAIVQRKYARHPSLSHFYWTYARILRAAKRKEDAQRVEELARALPNELVGISIVPSR